ncbi:hypothetical protein CONCODRAFT_2556 [Conidiobolus coronatus NRRL 28638]|uniref:Uncharacterized protein n=1 Tax=Conidiobolus coronatus (strain ATCC 28846 / CBS 209.66 / NRRL 28638) TaxID=796925 RepID=A0A137PH91_CONC2|nr:hypothetical protein CONCODRAFT_2556 [Conidiobolus coronatus NRRL 28638]|eukprot:KXN74352.1 hypothetical protein CONCODRAFT_2556 [Conidiobolus coronatus NRRL 28638]
MLLSQILYQIIINFSLLSQLSAAVFNGTIIQDRHKYSYKDYYSHDANTCIVSKVIQNVTDLDSQVPSIQQCDQNYVINNQTLILPRNTFPICEFTPTLYDAKTKDYTERYNRGFKNGNSTYEAYKSECLEELKLSSKARVEDQYDVSISDTACLRYGEFLTVTYGKSAEIEDFVETVETLISNDIRWNNTKIQATLFVSIVCGAVNKEGCISIMDHLLSEKDSSILNLIGLDVGDNKPSTWLYADGIDIELLHNHIEIMGMELETKVVNDVHYHSIKGNRTTGSYEFIKKKPGLVGGFPKN